MTPHERMPQAFSRVIISAMGRIIAYSILGALVGGFIIGPLIGIYVLHIPADSDITRPILYGVIFGVMGGLISAISLNYAFRNYVEPPMSLRERAQRALAGPNWKLATILTLFPALLISWIITTITGINQAWTFIALAVISYIPFEYVLKYLDNRGGKN